MNQKTWCFDDKQLFPVSLAGLRQPDGGVFVALEGQSTDDGRVFVNFFQDDETLRHVVTEIRANELDNFLAQAKIFFKSKDFKSAIAEDESEHAVAYWRLNDEKVLAMVASTQGSDLLSEKAVEWLGSCQVSKSPVFEGLGCVSPESDVITSFARQSQAPRPKF